MIDFHGLPAVRWRSPGGASAVATLQGAHIVSWTPAGGRECLYLSDRSPFVSGRAIRGGIPVAFPQFADRGSLAQHGFARNLPWTFAGLDENGEVASARFVLESSPQALSAWPHPFRLELVANLGDAHLDVLLRVENPGPEAFSFTAALHTYVRVADASRARLRGLRFLRFAERGSTRVEVEEGEFVTAVDPIDRIYFATPARLALEDAGRVLRIEQRGFTDTVVWNPGRERSAQMPDMPPDGYLRMLCVEAAAIEPPVSLAPGAAWVGEQVLAIA